MSQPLAPAVSPVSPQQARRLFIASCVALTTSAMGFAIVGDITNAWKQEFLLSNELVGWLAAAGTGFTIAMVALGPLCDALGMGKVVALAFVCHLLGLGLTVFAGGFGMLFLGGGLHAFGGGAIEAACNPLIATIYPDQKTKKLNQFHMWFPGGIVIGGVGAYLLTRLEATGLALPLDYWQVKLMLMLLPNLAYGLMFLGMPFPPTERVAAGVSFGGMVRETLCRPLFLVLLGCMCVTASLELGPNRWIPPVLESGGVPGILVLVWITGLMAVLRFFAGPVVKALGNIGVMLASSVVGGAGLLLLSYARDPVTIGVAATIFAVGVCYMWPTMIGTAAERVPKGGALALGLLGGLGGLFVNVVAIPRMGGVADTYLHQQLTGRALVEATPVDQQARTVAALERVLATYPAWVAALPAEDRLRDLRASEVESTQGDVQTALAAWKFARQLPAGPTATALRSALRNGPPGKPDAQTPATLAAAQQARAEVASLLGPAENFGGLMSFRYAAPFALIPILIFGVMWLQDRAKAKARAAEPELVGAGKP